MAVSWILVVMIVVVAVLVLIGSVYFMWYFGSDVDQGTAYFAKSMVVLTFAMSAYNVLIAPLDVANREVNGGINITLLIKINYYIVTSLLIFVIPFCVFFYENEDPDADAQNAKYNQVYYAIVYSVITMIVIVGLIALLYALIGYANIPVILLKNQIENYGKNDATACYRYVNGVKTITCRETLSIMVIRVTLFVYAISVVGAIGLVFFLCFGGIGMVALPMDLIQGFREAELAMTPADYAAKKVAIGARASSLATEGQSIQADERASGGRRSRRQRNRFNRFKKDVFLLEQDFNKMQDSWRARRHPYWYFVDLFLGLLSAIICIMWFIHICVFMIPKNNPHAFLNTLFIKLTFKGFNLFGAIAYGVFVFYLLIAVMKGNTKVGLRFAFITIHPIRYKNTMANAFLFNGAVVLAASVSVVQFASSAFSYYTRLTATSSIFAIQINNLKGIGQIFTWARFAFLAIMALTAVWLGWFPSDTRRMKEAKARGDRRERA